MTFHEWYESVVLPRLYVQQEPYERESIAFQSIEKLSKQELLGLFTSMQEDELRLAFFDHVRSCMQEGWDPTEEEPEEFKDL